MPTTSAFLTYTQPNNSPYIQNKIPTVLNPVTKPLFLSTDALQSLHRVTELLSGYDHGDFPFPHNWQLSATSVERGFLVSAICAEAIEEDGLGLADNAISPAKRIKLVKDEGVRDLFNALLPLLERSSVRDTIKSAQSYDSFVHPALRWLSYDAATNSLNVCQTPSCYAFLYTLFVATMGREAYAKPALRGMQASLILEMPSRESVDALNADQLYCLLYFFAESARYYFAFQSPSSDTADCSYKGLVKNFSHTKGASFYLVIRTVASDKPYSIALKDDYFNLTLQKKEIDDVMRSLEGKSESLDLFCSKVYVPFLNTKFFCYTNYRDETLLKLSPEGKNTYVYSEGRAQGDLSHMLISQFVKTECYLPSADDLEADIAHEPFLTFINEHAEQLYKVPQAYITKHVVKTASLEALNVASYVLINKIHNGEPYTLPGSREIIENIQSVLGRILGERDGSSSDAILLEIVSQETLILLDQVIGHLPDDYFAEITFLYDTCGKLSEPEQFSSIADQLYNFYRISCPIENNIPFEPNVVISVVVCALSLLSMIYIEFQKAHDQEDQLDTSYSIMEAFFKCNHVLLNRGLFLQCFSQEHIDLDFFNKTWCMPISLAGVSLNLNNYHDNRNMKPDFLFFHDHFLHAFRNSAMIDSAGKFQIHLQKIRLATCYEQVKDYLFEVKEPVNTPVGSFSFPDILNVMEVQLFNLTHESSGVPTHSRARLLPISFEHTYLEKLCTLFTQSSVATSQIKVLSKFDEIPKDLKALLPEGLQDALPHFAACSLLDVIVQFTREIYEKRVPFDVQQCVNAFYSQLELRLSQIIVFSHQWEKLIVNNILPKSFSRIALYEERQRILMLPHIQNALYSGVIDWDVGADSRMPAA